MKAGRRVSRWGVPLLLMLVFAGQPAGECLAGQRAPQIPGDPLEGSGEVRRRHLSHGQLSGLVQPPASPVRDQSLGLPARAAAPLHSFAGRLELLGEESAGGWRVLTDWFDFRSDRLRRHLPEFDFEYVQLGSHLIPARRGLVITSHPRWNYILGPGRAWSERGDLGLSRASLAFALVSKNHNCTHNGTLMFLFDDEEVSRLWYQVTQETCLYFKADLWGMLDAAYHPGRIQRQRQVQRRYAREVKRRVPRVPIARLAADYPGLDPSRFASGIDRRHVTLYGLIAGGVNYAGPCRTRYGEYPHCESMRVPSYSTAKSAFAGVALMRLARLYGEEVTGLLIRDYLPEAAAAVGDWSRVTFENALDMTTGNYFSPGTWEDENGPAMSQFFNAETYAERIAAAFDAPYQEPPGSRWVYRSSDTFILTRAMQVFLESRQGPGADIFDRIVRDVFKPLKIGPGARTTLRTSENNWQGQTLGYMGLFWIADDIAKITGFLNLDGGAVNGRQLLHPGLLAGAMQLAGDDRGVSAGPDWQYNQGFHAFRYGESELWPGQPEFWAPFMLGYGGIVFVMMPNGTTYYYASDNDEFSWRAAVIESMRNVPRTGGPTGPDRRF